MNSNIYSNAPFSELFERLFSKEGEKTVPIRLLPSLDREQLSPFAQKWLEKIEGFEQFEKGEPLLIPTSEGESDEVLIKAESEEPTFLLADLSKKLPKGNYRLDLSALNQMDEKAQSALFLGFGLGAYQFTAYKEQPQNGVKLLLPEALKKSVKEALYAHYLVRNLINEPANILNPDYFATLVRMQFADQNIKVKEISGDALIKENFPLIYTVGAGSRYAPRLIELSFGDENHPKLTIVGKGVCFDSGGLDIKPSNGMRLMKKDMGGAAHALALSRWILESELPYQVRLLLPIVENSISAHSMRPGDIVKARNGLNVEIDNTDAEGRLILADALAYAGEEPYDLLINFATLTGAARVALGPELPALFSNSDPLAQQCIKSGESVDDLLWQLPLHKGYQSWIEPMHADLLNASKFPFGGAITAALFLERFINPHAPFFHIDVMAWNIRERKGRPIGGEAMGLRAIYHLLENLSEKNYFKSPQ